VIDEASVLSASSLSDLEGTLARIEASTGSQIVVWLVPSTGAEDIAALAFRAASLWKVGRRDQGDGLLLVVGINDRRARIEVSKSLEGVVPDVIAGRIIRDEMAPRFAAGDYAGGLKAGVLALASRIKAEVPAVVGDPVSSPEESRNWVELGVFVFFAAAIAGNIARQLLGTRLGSALVGALAGAVVWYLTRGWSPSALAGVGGFLLSLLMSRSRSTMNGQHFGAGSGGSSWTGSHPEQGSEGGGFRSGGGGNYGGGGASGGW
jgi:uncharacterized protein